MSQVVYKYYLPIRDAFDLELPKGAKILLVAVQHGVPQLWALVHPDAPVEARHFRLVGTGDPIEDYNLLHVGSFLDGNFVWHLFDGGSE